MDTPANDRTYDEVIWRKDLEKRLGLSSTTLWRMMRTHKIPAPDVDLSRQTKGWRLSTLHRAGIHLPATNEPIG